MQKPILFMLLVLLTIIGSPHVLLAMESIEKQSRSRFRYQDENKLPDNRYDKPPPADDLLTIEMSGFRKRLIGIEERLEVLERKFHDKSEEDAK